MIHRTFETIRKALLGLALLGGTMPVFAQTDPLINEFVANHTGSDSEAFVEIFGDAGTDYSAFTILEIEGDSTGAGIIDAVLPVGTTDAGGFFVDDEDAENGSITWLLVEGFTGSSGDDLDADNDGTFDATPWTRVVDDVAVSDGGSSDRVYSSTVLTGGFDGVSFTPGGASRIPNGTDTDAVADWVRNDFDGAGLPGFVGTPDAGEALNTPGAVNQIVSAADPLINEFVANHTGSDVEAFVEIFGAASTDYSAFTILEIEGDSTGAGVIDAVLPVGTTDAGGFFVDDEDAENGSITWLLVEGFTGSLFSDLDTDNDGVLDSTPWTRLVDDVGVSDGGGSDRVYSSTVLTGGFDGVSFTPGGASRIPNGTDTDAVADWVRNDFDGAGLPGFVGTPVFGEAFNTPGAVNEAVPPPSGPALVINEILQNPSAVSDGAGEWFEIFNPTGAAVDMDGWTIKDNDFDSFTITGALSIPAGGYLVFGTNADSLTNGGLSVDYEYGGGFFLSNGSDELVLLDAFSSEIDRVEWDNGATFPDPNGASMALKNPALNNNVGANWCESSTPFGAGDRGTPGAPNDCFAGLVINEVDADDSGTDDEEFVEIYDGGEGGTDLSGLVLVLFNGSDDASYRAFDLDGFATDGDGFFVICGNAANVPGCDLDVSPDTNLIQNGADAVALLVGDAADFPNDTPVTTDGLLDALVYDTFDADDAGLLVLLNAGQPQVNEGGAGNKDLHSNQRCPNGFGGQRNTDAYVQDTPTAGALNNCPPLEIFDIQGAGTASVYDGFIVGTDGDVVTAVGPDGFFMQTPSAGSDGNTDTSDGIFVFTGGPPSVAVGDLVDVTGAVDEFFGFTEITGSPAVTVVGGGLLPPPVAFSAAVPSPDPLAPSCAIEYECYEGMLVEVAEGTVTGPNQRFGPDPIAEVHVVARVGRAFREPGVEFPGLFMPPIPTWDGNPEVFELDPDKLGLANQIIPAGSTFSATGVLGFEFGGYELWPSVLDVVPAPLPVAVRAREPGELTVGTLNLFRLFDDIDDPADPDGRNDTVVSTAVYERRLDKFCAYIDEVLDSPDILAVQEAESLTVLEDLAEHIANDVDCDSGVAYTPYLLEGNDFGTIDVGFLVRDHITVDAITQVDKDLTFIDPTEGDEDIVHDRPPLLLEGSCQLDFGSYPISVMVVHNRSLNDIDDPDRGPFVRFKRYFQAESIAAKVQELQDADPDVRLVVLGDFNAFEFTDGYVDTVNFVRGDYDPAQSFLCSELACDPDPVEPDLDNVVLGVDAEERYSFIFRGSGQVLDHALTSHGLAGEVAGAEYGRGNADAAFDLFNDDGSVVPGNKPLRSSDHDGLVVYITKDEDADGVPNDLDVCAGTVIPESVPTTGGLRINRWALVDDDGIFDTNPPEGRGPRDYFDLGQTAGCSCEQIIDALGLGNGQRRFGCSLSNMRAWRVLVNP